MPVCAKGQLLYCVPGRKPSLRIKQKKKERKKGMFRTVLFFHNVSKGSKLTFRMNKDLFVLFMIN